MACSASGPLVFRKLPSIVLVKSLLVGTPEGAAVAVGGLCEDGPASPALHLNPQLLHDEIRRLLASRR